jgi:cysteine synthase
MPSRTAARRDSPALVNATVPLRGGRARTIAASVADLIGGTPLVRLTLPGFPSGVTALAKLEAANPLSSIKDRVSLFMLRAAERRGEIVPGSGTIVEATSGCS